MLNKITVNSSLVTIILAGILVVPTDSFGAIDNPQKPVPSSIDNIDKQFQKDLESLHAFRVKNRKPEDLRKFVIGVQNKWHQKDELNYLKLMLESCQVLRSPNYNDGFLAYTYANTILKETKNIPLDIEIGFVECLWLQYDNTLVGAEKDWLQSRSEITKLWFHPLQRIEKDIDKNFNLNTVPANTVSPPPGSGIILPGMPASAIKDPELRAIYEADIAKNKEQSKKYLYQHQLRNWRRTFTASLENYLILAYSKRPYNREELEHNLNLYVKDESFKKRVLAEVDKAIQHNAQIEKNKSAPQPQ